MREEEEFIIKPHRRLRIWIDCYKTQQTDQVLTGLLESLHRLDGHIIKLAIVGFTVWDRWRFRRLLRKSDFKVPKPLRFFQDPEVAKTWLVSD